MRILKSQLKQIVKEEVQNFLNEENDETQTFGQVVGLGKIRTGKTGRAAASTPRKKERRSRAGVGWKPPIAPKPPPGIKEELWEKAYASFFYHLLHGKGGKNFSPNDVLHVALVDFSLPASSPRLWIVNLATGRIGYGPVHVSHGVNSGRGNRVKKVGNRLNSNVSSVGAFKTGVARNSTAGHLGCRNMKNNRVTPYRRSRVFDKELGPGGMWRCKDGTKPLAGAAMELDGLDRTNHRARERHILFHGASYVGPDGAGNSNGCFATRPAVNKQLIKQLAGGSFVYAYHA